MTEQTRDQLADEARGSYQAGEFRAAWNAARVALDAHPHDPALLRLAGRAAMELGLDDAVDYFQRAVALDPNDPDGWRELGDALAYEGRLSEAGQALHRAVRLRPEDTAALVSLGHSSLAAGHRERAITYLSRALEHDPENLTALRGLVAAYHSEGRLAEALDAATRVATVSPSDVLAALDVAELSLELGRKDAAAAFGRLRTVDDDPEHEVFAYHGMIEAELRRDSWRRALDIAVDATRVDRHGRTTDILALIVARVFGEAGREAPSREHVEETLARSRAEHRRLHAEALVV
ncbi:MAG: tetratricopeptide repeat protein [Actinobacteria bacterium]|nr:tetratricopeptide repeat protein [Actinomycetota bacterium]